MHPLLNRRAALVLLMLPALGMSLDGQAGPLLDRLRERQGATPPQATGSGAATQVLRDVAYGPHADQAMDVYLPAQPQQAPVLLMVHGGGWKRGDKSMRRSIEAKVQRWVPRGFVLVSINYRMMPDAKPDVQLRDVALALTHVQQQAPSWGADPGRIVLMGHSAGAHLVTLLTVTPFDRFTPKPRPVLGTVSLDSGAMDVVEIMSHRHHRLYDEPFGQDPAYWRSVSPTWVMAPGSAPVLSVYSTRRDDATKQTQAFAAKGKALGVRVDTLGVDLSHGDINGQLGQDSDYTRRVETFMASLDSQVARLLR